MTVTDPTRLPEPNGAYTDAQRDRAMRLFVSSTFQDMKAERDWLTAQVFPQLRRLCERRGVAWSEVDLRWGITDEQAAAGEVVPICLRAVDRCRPFFIGMLGERYGWVPEQLPPTLVEEHPWLAEHADRSVTELEIVHGVLRDEQAAKHAAFYMRDPGSAPASADARLGQLKQRVRETAATVRDGFRTPQELGELVLADLTAVIDALFPPEATGDPVAAEIHRQEAAANAHAAVHVGRDGALAALDAFADGAQQALVVLGAPGSGKSALLATWALRRRAAHPADRVLLHLTGGSPYGADLGALLRRLNRELGGADTPEADFDAARRQFAQLLTETADAQRVVLVLDGLNELEPLHAAHELTWLPDPLPPNLRVIVSTLPGRVRDVAEERGWLASPLALGKLATAERAALIERYLDYHSKALDPALIEESIELPQSGNARFLRTLLEELRAGGDHEALSGRLGNLLDAPSLKDLYGVVLARLEAQHEALRPGLVRDAMALLWAARHGLPEAELLELLGAGGESIPQAAWAPLRDAADELLVEGGGRLALAHGAAREAIERRYLAAEEDRRAAHERLAGFALAQGPAAHTAPEAPWHLAEAGAWPELARLLSAPDWFAPLWELDPIAVRRYWARIEDKSGLRASTAYLEQVGPADHRYALTAARLLYLFDDCGGSLAVLDAVRATIEVATEHDVRRDLLARLADIRMFRGELEAADALLAQRVQLCTAADDQLGLAEGLLGQAEVAEQMGSHHRASELARDAGELARRAGAAELLARALAERARLLSRQGEPEQAADVYVELEQTARAIGDADRVAAALEGQATARGQSVTTSRTALEQHRADVRICRERGDRRGEANALQRLAMVHVDRGEAEPALAHGVEIERIGRAIGAPAVISDGLHAQGFAQRALGRTEAALESHRQVEAIARQSGMRGGIATALGNQALVLQALGDHEAARVRAAEAEETYRALNDLAGVTGLRLNRAVDLCADGNTHLAAPLLAEAEHAFRRLRDLEGLVRVLFQQSFMLEDMGQPAAAQEKLSEARRLAQIGGFSSLELAGQEVAAGVGSTVTLPEAIPPDTPPPAFDPPESLESATEQRTEFFVKRLLRPLPVGVTIALPVLMFIGGGTPLDALGAFGLALAFFAYRAWRWSTAAARHAFMDAYARSRGLELIGDQVLPPLPPLLRAGDGVLAERSMTGRLPWGLQGALAHLTVVRDYVSARGNDKTSAQRFTVVTHWLPSLARLEGSICCEPRTLNRVPSRDGNTRPEGLAGLVPVRSESVVLEQRYEILRDPGADENWMRQLFSPSFIVFLSEQPPDGFGFELTGGVLCAFVPRHRGRATELDELCRAAGAVARRLGAEVEE